MSPDVGIEQRQRNKAEIQRENRQKTQEGSSTPVELSDSSTLGMQLGVAMIGGETSLEVLKQEQQERNERKKAVCQYHFGEVVNKYFTCCFGHTSSDGCILSDQHSFAPDASGYLEHEWKFHSTPTPRPQPAARLGVTSNRSRRRLGSVIPSQEHRLAIALDCEMGTAQSRNSELIRLTVVDFFTGATLIDSLVVPSVPMLHYNTRYSGVTFAMMREASRSGNCIRGRDAAREALWRFVGPETVVVLHGGENDTIALRWMCGKVVDTFLLAGNMKEGKIKGGRSLKNLNLELLGRNVQMGRKGHDSLEDALATRELANWFIERGETL
ncbi:hypothetical protein FGG08_002283 [Glutinoglossum americanum]|uniref:Exonuclease domain-containing protein n=1 Tax=Glutinoglossum americanum TaxID=1670608 RepID=A0A9P8I9K6_9PEZI|nr:hypothetical protein FGG08_002283 [Glutinoglossum americanum]